MESGEQLSAQSTDEDPEMDQHAISVLTAVLHEDREELRHIESQRSTLSGFILVIASAAVGLLTQIHLKSESSMIGGLLVILGLYGIVASSKLNERHWYFRTRVDKWY